MALLIDDFDLLVEQVFERLDFLVQLFLKSFDSLVEQFILLFEVLDCVSRLIRNQLANGPVNTENGRSDYPLVHLHFCSHGCVTGQ